MAATHRHNYKNAFNGFSFFQDQHNATYRRFSSTPDHAFPLLAISVLSITGTAFLLVGYYIFVNKCCSNWHHINLLRWFTIWRARRSDDSFIAFSPAMWNRGLDESAIREIPAFQYTRGEGDQDKSIYGCVVCLNEFQEQDMLRVLPNCSHAFHLDCIDIWFQSNDNCPLCRTSISGTTKYPLDRIIAPSSSPQGSQPYNDSLMGGDEDYVVIELGGEDGVFLPNRQLERDISREVHMQFRNQSPMELEQKPGTLKSRKHHVSIMGDECVDVRGQDDQFSIQPIRRSFSLDSAADRQLYSSVHAIIQQHRSEISATEENGNRVRRSFFPFSHGRGSRKAVLPVEFDL